VGPATNVLHLNFNYLAVDRLFLYHLNAFHDIPINYMTTPLVAFNTPSLTPITYTNVVNYTTVTVGYAFTLFSEPLSNYRVVSFLTTMDLSSALTTDQLTL
jgi:hypothetical protein